MSSTPSISFWSYLIPLYVGWRVWWANRVPLMDCDEVYNYWEPLHFLLFGNGLETWEYSNKFALRTYAYLAPLVSASKGFQFVIPYLPAWVWPLLTDQVVLPESASSHVALFILLRATLAGGMALAEVSFCKAIHQQDPKSNYVISIVTACLMLSSAGMSHASGALLPSSTLTFLWLLGTAAFLRRQYLLFSTMAILATLAIGWPFGVVMFAALGIAVLVQVKKRLFSFLFQVLLITIFIQGLVMMIDQKQYGRWVSPTLNILIYNTQGEGDELYGIEPLSYYFKNLALNFNYVMLGAAALPFMFLNKNYLFLILIIPMSNWFAAVLPRPHKEERFLFPVYPSICFGAAYVSIFAVDVFWKSIRTSPLEDRYGLMLQALLWAPAGVLSFFRTMALSKYYTAPLYVYAQLQNHPDVADSVVCTCGEWYRFPSSFYLPSTIKSFGFVQSSFEGQLPQPFQPAGSRSDGNLVFNDRNKPEPTAYTSIDECDYLIDLWTSECRENDSLWQPIAHAPFLDAEKTSTIHRTLYIPGEHEQEEKIGNVEYVDYVLYQRVAEPE